MKTKTVSLDDSHEDYVDTSIENNPTTTDKAISIFKRKKSKDSLISDGNPLVYALKNIKGWNISEKDKQTLFDRVKTIINKINIEFDVIIIPESSSNLNKILADIIGSAYNNIPVLNNCLLKRTKEEVLDDIEWSVFTPSEMDRLKESFDKMKGEYFEAKFFPKNEELIQKFEVAIYKINPDTSGKDVIGKRILVIDDVVSSGMTLSRCAQTLKECFFPKSVHNIVLFSSVE